MFNLGLLYENGQGVVQDYAKAREWYQKAADKGHVFAKESPLLKQRR
jgi:TPR repeat protein